VSHNESNLCHNESNIYYDERDVFLDKRRRRKYCHTKQNVLDDVQDCMSRKILAEHLHMIFSVYAVIMINRLYAANYRQEVTVHCTEHLQFYNAAVLFDRHQFGMD